jgi:hypothetical protein
MTFGPQLGLVRAVYATDDSIVISEVTIPNLFLPARAMKGTPSCVTLENSKSSSELYRLCLFDQLCSLNSAATL